MAGNIYVGRFIIVLKTRSDSILVGYRVSSRSFANRKIIRNADVCSVVPISPDEYKDNPYISYNCLRITDNTLVVSNGSQTDSITEKISMGYPVRDALASSLLILDYEKDKYNTPRIACVADYQKGSATLAIVKPEKLEVRELTLKSGEAYLISTYEITDPMKSAVNISTTSEFSSYLMKMEYTHPVCCLAAGLLDGKPDISIQNP